MYSEGDPVQNNESLKQQCLNQLISGSNREGGTAPSDKSQPTEKQQEGTIMTRAAHESAKICHSNSLANLQGDAHSVRRHETDLNLNLDHGNSNLRV